MTASSPVAWSSGSSASRSVAGDSGKFPAFGMRPSSADPVRNRAWRRAQSAAEIGFGRQTHEQHAGRAADRAAAMAAAADIVGEKHLAAAAAVLRAVAGFDFERAGKHEEKLAPGGGMPVLVEAFGHFGHH